MSIVGQGRFFTIYFPGFVFLCFTRPRYQVSVYRTTGPLVSFVLDLVGRPEDRFSHNKAHLSLVMRKLDFCICENKGAADQHLCFHFLNSTIPLSTISLLTISEILCL